MSRKKIRKLKGNEDLFELFGGEEEDGQRSDAGSQSSEDRGQKKTQYTRHGVPVIEKSYGDLQGKSKSALLNEKGIEKKGKKQSVSKLVKNYPAPQSELDLHGETSQSAEFRADNYIRSALSRGLLTLRIIVGKGTHSEFGAVLPDTIEDLLNKLKKEKVVLSFRWEKKVKRKSGAIIVYLP